MTLYKYQYVANWVNVISRLLLSSLLTTSKQHNSTMNHSVVVDLSLNSHFDELFLDFSPFLLSSSSNETHECGEHGFFVLPNDLLTKTSSETYNSGSAERLGYYMCWGTQSLQNICCVLCVRARQWTLDEQHNTNARPDFFFQLRVSVVILACLLATRKIWKEKKEKNRVEKRRIGGERK